MRSTRDRLTILLAVALMSPAAAAAQSSLEDALKQYSATSVQGYIQPLGDLFGANMNSALFQPRAVPATGLSFHLSIIGMASPIGDDQKNYTAQAPAGFSPSTFQTPTVFGGQGQTTTDTASGLTYRGSDGLINASLFPTAVPQLTIGAIAGTEAIVRFVTTPEFGNNNEFPKATLLAIGVRHSLNRYLGGLPVDLTAAALYSTFKVGDIVDFKGTTLGVQASKGLALVTVYGGAAWEHSTMNLSYTSTDPSAPGSVSVDLKGKSSFRFVAGAGLKLLVVRLFADANFGSVTTFSGGIALF